MPVSDLIAGIEDAPANVRDVSEKLVYRDFVTVGLLLEDLEVHEETTDGRTHIRDNWIYIQDEDVRLGRLQVFNNWSPYMVATQPRFGSDSSTFATKATISGKSPIRRWPTSEPASSRGSASLTAAAFWIQWS